MREEYRESNLDVGDDLVHLIDLLRQLHGRHTRDHEHRTVEQEDIDDDGHQHQVE